MTLKTGRKCNWDEIEVGEVFAHNGCWQVHCKVSETKSITLTIDFDGSFSLMGVSTFRTGYPKDGLYKLPKSVQALWKEV